MGFSSTIPFAVVSYFWPSQAEFGNSTSGFGSAKQNYPIAANGALVTWQRRSCYSFYHLIKSKTNSNKAKNKNRYKEAPIK
jgi:hypothetical protein